jgi:DNA gyrase/topoisomerase IV subunit B
MNVMVFGAMSVPGLCLWFLLFQNSECWLQPKAMRQATGMKCNKLSFKPLSSRSFYSSSDLATKLFAVPPPNPLFVPDVQQQGYGSESITVLKGLEPVRKRPGMYIGSTGTRGLHHLVFEIVDNSVDEALAGHCTEIFVTMNGDGSIEVKDNGRGIPCARHAATGKSTLETVLCVLHAGGKFGGEASGYRVSGGLHGVGLSVVNALSDRLVVQVVRDDTYHSMEFSRGDPITELQVRPSLPHETRGTSVVFKPDPTIFKTTLEFEFEKLAARLDELAYLNAGLTIHLVDNRPKAKGDDSSLSGSSLAENVGVAKKVTFRHDGGIKELVEVMCEGKAPLLVPSDSPIPTTAGSGMLICVLTTTFFSMFSFSEKVVCQFIPNFIMVFCSW